MEQHTLKNCPFCGAKANHIKGRFTCDGAVFYRAYCCNMECNVRTDPCKTRKKATDKWNCRTLPRRSEAVLLDLANGVISVGDAMELLEGMK